MVSDLRRFVVTVDRVSSRLLGQDGSLRNIRAQLEDRRRVIEEITVLERRLAAVTARDIPCAA